MIFNQLESALSELGSLIEGNEDFQFKQSYLMIEAFNLNKFEFFNAFIQNGIAIEQFIVPILNDYESRISQIYNRRINSYKVFNMFFNQNTAQNIE